MRIITFFFCIIILSNCGIHKEDDVYSHIKKGEELKIEIIKRSKQIYFYKEYLILVYDISNNYEYYDPHLLFFDKNLKLVSGAYFASEKIEKIVDNQIIGFLNETRIQRIEKYRNDLPPKFQINLLKLKEERSSSQGNILIKNFIISKSGNNLLVNLVVKKAQDPYYSLQWNNYSTDTEFLKEFTEEDTLQFKLSELLFDSKRSLAFTRTLKKNDELSSNQMIISTPQTLNDFYLSIWEEIQNWIAR